MLTLSRTTAANADFIALVKDLDADLAIRDGEDHAFYAQFNKTNSISHVLVAYNEAHEPVGCGALKPCAANAMEVKRMWVIPAHRCKGIASKILNALELWAAELGYNRCILETGKNQPEALVLYPKNGYKIIPNYGQYAGVENSICFEKQIGLPMHHHHKTSP